MRFERAQAREVVSGREHMDERQRRLHAACQRLIRGTTEKRIQPDYPACSLPQRRERSRELFWFTSVPSVAKNDHNGTPVDASQPLNIKRCETRSDARATRPALYVLSQTIECALVRLVLQLAGYPRQRSGKNKRFDFRETVLKSINKLQQQTAVHVHRSRNITDHEELRPLRTASPESEIDQFATGF